MIVYGFGTVTLKGRTRIRWQDKVKKDGTQTAGKVWKESLYNRRSYLECQGIVTFCTCQWNE
jgi:hypothetical protein